MYSHEYPFFATFWTISSPDETVANGVYEAASPEVLSLYTMKNWLPLLSAVPLLAIATVPAGYVAPVVFSVANWYPGPPVPTLPVVLQVSLVVAVAYGSP